MRAAREQLGRLRRALHVLRRQAGGEVPRKVLDHAEACAHGGELRGARSWREVGTIRQEVGREIRSGAVELNVLDAPGELCLERVAELELVERVAGNARVFVGIEQATERTGHIARRRELLMPRLYAERRRERREPHIERQERDLEATLLLLVGEGLADAVAERIRRVGKAELVVFVVGRAQPEPDRVDGRPVGRYSPLLSTLVCCASIRELVAAPSMVGM